MNCHELKNQQECDISHLLSNPPCVVLKTSKICKLLDNDHLERGLYQFQDHKGLKDSFVNISKALFVTLMATYFNPISRNNTEAVNEHACIILRMSALDQTGEKRGKSALDGAGTQERALTLARHLRNGHRVRQAAVWRKEPFEPRINRT